MKLALTPTRRSALSPRSDYATFCGFTKRTHFTNEFFGLQPEIEPTRQNMFAPLGSIQIKRAIDANPLPRTENTMTCGFTKRTHFTNGFFGLPSENRTQWRESTFTAPGTIQVHWIALTNT